MPDSDGADWQLLAERISARHRGRDSLIRGVAVVGDYARNQVWEGSLLQILLFRHRSEALIDEGGVVEENGFSVTVDSITSGSLVELEELLHLEPLAGNLADMHTLRMADPTLRDVLASFRDRYHSADGRQLRARRALQRARVALDDYDSTKRPIFAIEAVRSGIYPAASALVGERVDALRMPRRLRAASRLLKLPELLPQLNAALQSESVDLSRRWDAVERLHALARSHLDARMPEVGSALVPRLERALIPARRGSDALLTAGDRDAAAWVAMSAAAELDGVVEAAPPGWRERDDYRDRSMDVYGRPSPEILRHACVEIQSRVD
ncbi:MAG: hypothetical protein OXI41_01055 [Chloroflexota bacterium]|nr:hypothetical protein [Chloroflexota bacterium]MDE2896165.1 hypothetical protein [Chloroflexota bacterium]